MTDFRELLIEQLKTLDENWPDGLPTRWEIRANRARVALAEFESQTMTDADKLFALTELMNDVIYTLEMKQYDIEDPQLSHECVTDADKFRQIMNDILYPES